MTTNTTEILSPPVADTGDHKLSVTEANNSNRTVPPTTSDSEWIMVGEKKKAPKRRTVADTLKSKTNHSLQDTQQTKTRTPLIVGSSKSNALISAPKKSLSYIHVSRLSPSTESEDIMKFLSGILPAGESSCGKLNSKQPKICSSFKLTFPS